MDTEVCSQCGGYGTVWRSQGASIDRERYELDTCQECTGDGYVVPRPHETLDPTQPKLALEAAVTAFYEAYDNQQQRRREITHEEK